MLQTEVLPVFTLWITALMLKYKLQVHMEHKTLLHSVSTENIAEILRFGNHLFKFILMIITISLYFMLAEKIKGD